MVCMKCGKECQSVRCDCGLDYRSGTILMCFPLSPTEKITDLVLTSRKVSVSDSLETLQNAWEHGNAEAAYWIGNTNLE